MSSDREPLILRQHKHFDSYEVDLAESETLLQNLVLGAEGITCPIPFCECDCVHPERVTVNAGGSITVVEHGGTTMRAGEASGRGVLVRIQFSCEWGHRFSLGFQFHKGNTGVELNQGEDYDPEGEAPRTIWRD
jgi:hypothetical protein